MNNASCFLCESQLPEETATEDSLCTNCADSIKNPAFLQCVECKYTWGIVDPGPLKYGITVEAGQTYYTKGCCFCRGEELGTVDITGVCATENKEDLAKRTHWMKPVSAQDISNIKQFSKLKFTTFVEAGESSKEKLAILADLVARTNTESYIGKTNKFYTWFTPQRKKSSSKFSFVKL